MKDLIGIVAQCKQDGVQDDGVRMAICEAVFDELKQMNSVDFSKCVTSASIDRNTKAYIVVLKFEGDIERRCVYGQ